MARRFRFRLETLLNVRRLREREAQRKVAAQGAAIARLDAADRQALSEIAEQQRTLLAAQQTGLLDASGLQRGRAWINHLRRAMTLRAAERAQLQQKLVELQGNLREARKQTRVLEKLRERRLDAYETKTAHQEQAAADELAQQLLLRERAESLSS